MIAIIVGIAEGNVIGLNGQLPWAGKLPADMRYFKRTTMGHPVIMGRKTWASLPLKFRPLEGRRNIVLTRHVGSFNTNGAEICDSLEMALAATSDATEVFVIGGSEIYALAMPLAERMYITRVIGEFEGDAFFPAFHIDEWDMISRVEQAQDEKNKFACVFEVLQRRERV